MKSNVARRGTAGRPEEKPEGKPQGKPQGKVVPLRERDRSIVPWALDTLEQRRQAEAESEAEAETPAEAAGQTKKSRILELFRRGTDSIPLIAETVGARPSYVAQVLSREGLISGYFDLYTSTSQVQNVYSAYFRNVLSFKDVAAAERSIQRINELYQTFHRQGDRAGQHQAMVVALTGMNRARWCGKTEEAQVFRKWLMSH